MNEHLLTARELATAWGVSPEQAAETLTALERSGHVVRRGTRWQKTAKGTRLLGFPKHQGAEAK